MKITTSQLFETVSPLLRDGGTVSFCISGNSMLPFLRNGERVTLIRKSEYLPGDIVLARTDRDRYCKDGLSCRNKDVLPNSGKDGLVVLHYVVSFGDGIYKLMGSANLRQVEYCRAEDIAGYVIMPIISRHKIMSWHKFLPIRRYLLFLLRKISSYKEKSTLF